MVKQMLIVAALLVSPAALAADQTPAAPVDGVDKEICHIIGPDKATCLNASATCEWDDEDKRCEPIAISKCRSVSDEAFCKSLAPQCFWDDADPHGPRCENP
jgi:hypothetical protein